ncbi:MAG TPA: hypothetical protein VG711_01400 [Phycisphaerales bacterium]|nr:hypothetical protein [Phycisphaerales bacterium]
MSGQSRAVRGHFLRAFRTASAAAIAVMVVFGSGCSHNSNSEQASATTQSAGSVEDHAEKDGVDVVVSATPKEVKAGERVTLRVRAEYASGKVVEMPTVSDKLGAFEVVERDTPPDVLVGERRAVEHTYVLETLDTGEVVIPNLRVGLGEQLQAVTQPSESQPEDANAIKTAELKIQVDSNWPADANAMAFNDIKGAVEVNLGHARDWWLWAGIGAAAIAALAMTALVVRKVAGRGARDVRVPAHEWAMREMEKLKQEGLIERSEHFAFVSRLSGIVREYIERRFALMAPERTTEEFLREAKHSRLLTDEHQKLLGVFLRFADMVKFAKHVPMPAECEDSLDSAIDFVKQTVPRMEAAGSGGGA